MYTIEFYEDANGNSELWNYLEELREKSHSSKDARIQYKQISLYIQLLQDNGTHLPDNITKYLGDEIWELRPGNNRVFYFSFENNHFILLHCFRKKSQKTPRRELQKAIAERADYISRKKDI
ncbi:MAG: type II toxin-antitoxin system RelE/ParE family toxin [Dorea sp.]|nr:type II toxin-antitoxin system RelE/ParE family toxin [Dorea sp.]